MDARTVAMCAGRMILVKTNAATMRLPGFDLELLCAER